jgi:hypothetical protein
MRCRRCWAERRGCTPTRHRPPATVAPARRSPGLLMERGPVAAAEVADVLGLTGTAVRRHVDALIAGRRGAGRQAGAPRPARSRPSRPARTRSPTWAGPGSATATTTWPSPRCATWPSTAASPRCAASRTPGSRADRPGADQITAADGPADRAVALAGVLTLARLRGPGPHGRPRRAAVPAPLPGRAGSRPSSRCCARLRRAPSPTCSAPTVQRLATIARGDTACTTHIPPTCRASARPSCAPAHRPSRSIPTRHPPPRQQHGPRQGGSSNDDHS